MTEIFDFFYQEYLEEQKLDNMKETKNIGAKKVKKFNRERICNVISYLACTKNDQIVGGPNIVIVLVLLSLFHFQKMNVH